MHLGTLRRLTCSVCGDDAGRWHQHYNRDNGFGVCRQCVEWVTSESRGQHRQDADQLRRNYGEEGINYAPSDPVTCDR